MGRRLGLIIGVNSYQDTVFRSLQFAETDALALAQWLVNTKGGNWSPADVQHVQGTQGTRELVETLITQLCVNTAGPGDLVFIYFGGHAFLDEKSGEGYLALANTQYQQPSTGLHLPSLARQAMSNSRASHIVFMLDCFQTGPVWNVQRSSAYDSKPLLGSSILNAVQYRGNRLFFCSCRGHDRAPETGEKNLGLLAYRMILGLCGPAADAATGQITLQGLQAFLANTLGEQQRPQLFGQEQSPLVLVGNMPTPVPQIPKLQSPQPATSFSSGVSNRLRGQSPVPIGSLPTQSTQYATATAQVSPQISPITSGLLAPSSTNQQQSLVLLKQAQHFIQMQKPGEAFNTAEQVLQLDPTNIAALIIKGQLLGTAGRFQDALSVVQQVIQQDANNALAWSMRAALLANTGQHQEALQAIKRSLALDPNNPESYSIKTSITDHIAAIKSRENNLKVAANVHSNASDSTGLFISMGMQFLGLILVLVGAGISILLASLPISVPIFLQSLGLALLCVNAARGAYRYGFAHVVLTIVSSGLIAGILGGLYKFGYTRIILMLRDHPQLLIPVLFVALFLGLAAVVPLVLALGGFIVGLILGVRRRKR